MRHPPPGRGSCTAAGTWTISLTASNACGSLALSLSNDLEVTAEPTSLANFTATPTSPSR